MLMRFILALLISFGGLASAQAAFRAPTAKDLHGDWVAVAQVLSSKHLNFMDRDRDVFLYENAFFKFHPDGEVFWATTKTPLDTLGVIMASTAPSEKRLRFAGPDRTGLVRVTDTWSNSAVQAEIATAIATSDTSLVGLNVPVRRGELVLTFLLPPELARSMNVERQYMIRVLRRVDVKNTDNLPKQVQVVVLPGN